MIRDYLLDNNTRISHEACIEFLEKMRWPDGVECLYCQSKRVSKYTKKSSTRKRLNPDTGEEEIKPVPARILYVCLECGKQFSVTEGTIFNDTHLSLDKWVRSILNAHDEGLTPSEIRDMSKTAGHKFSDSYPYVQLHKLVNDKEARSSNGKYYPAKSAEAKNAAA